MKFNHFLSGCSLMNMVAHNAMRQRSDLQGTMLPLGRPSAVRCRLLQ